MSGEQLEEAEVDRLAAAAFEQRRLSHMLRRRGAEIEVLQVDRERLAERERAAVGREEVLRRKLREVEREVESLGEDRDRVTGNLKQAEYELRREERRLRTAREEMAAELAKTKEEAAAELAGAERDAARQHERAESRLEELRAQLTSLTANRDSVVTQLEQAEYEARRAERRLAKVDREAGEARRRARLQLEALREELREGMAVRDEALARAAEATRGVEDRARELGRAQREVELLVGLEKEREVLLAGSERTLAEVAEQLGRVRSSRSWRWGHRLAQAWRTVTFRRRSAGSALDSALERLGTGGEGVGEDERRR
jgi:chromosome segregation ATPase